MCLPLWMWCSAAQIHCLWDPWIGTLTTWCNDPRHCPHWPENDWPPHGCQEWVDKVHAAHHSACQRHGWQQTLQQSGYMKPSGSKVNCYSLAWLLDAYSADATTTCRPTIILSWENHWSDTSSTWDLSQWLLPWILTYITEKFEYTVEPNRAPPVGAARFTKKFCWSSGVASGNTEMENVAVCWPSTKLVTPLVGWMSDSFVPLTDHGTYQEEFQPRTKALVNLRVNQSGESTGAHNTKKQGVQSILSLFKSSKDSTWIWVAYLQWYFRTDRRFESNWKWRLRMNQLLALKPTAAEETAPWMTRHRADCCEQQSWDNMEGNTREEHITMRKWPPHTS